MHDQGLLKEYASFLILICAKSAKITVQICQNAVSATKQTDSNSLKNASGLDDYNMLI
ncbi:MAG: hypothetical protein WBE34_09915 [Candidatus Nitrosopolaris sp.]